MALRYYVSIVTDSSALYASTQNFPAGPLDEAHAKQLFARFGVPDVRERMVTTPEEAERAAHEPGGRVKIKIISSEITHKCDVGRGAINLNPEQVSARLFEAEINPVFVSLKVRECAQPMVSPYSPVEWEYS